MNVPLDILNILND